MPKLAREDDDLDVDHLDESGCMWIVDANGWKGMVEDESGHRWTQMAAGGLRRWRQVDACGPRGTKVDKCTCGSVS